MTEFSLHGRPLKVGDKVWNIGCARWECICQRYALGLLPDDIETVDRFQSFYAWDEPPAIDLASIPPPLCWIEGFPVRKGTAMMTDIWHACVVEGGSDGYVTFTTCKGLRGGAGIDHLTFAIPPNARPMQKVKRTVWINKYPQYDEGKIYPTEWDASINAIHGCQGQQSVTYSVEVPA